MRQFLIGAAAATAAFAGFAGTEASARFSPVAVEVPALVEYAACTVRRVRTVRPNAGLPTAPSAAARPPRVAARSANGSCARTAAWSTAPYAAAVDRDLASVRKPGV